MAAAALTVAINVSESQKAEEMGLLHVCSSRLDSLPPENVIRIEEDGFCSQDARDENNPYKIWSPTVLNTVNLSVEDIKPAYARIIEFVNNQPKVNTRTA